MLHQFHIHDGNRLKVILWNQVNKSRLAHHSLQNILYFAHKDLDGIVPLKESFKKYQ